MCRVLYRCELFDEGVSYPKSEIDVRIESFLTAQLQEDPVEAGALIIKTTNKNPEKIQTCVDTIKKIIQVSSEALQVISAFRGSYKFRVFSRGLGTQRKRLGPYVGPSVCESYSRCRLDLEIRGIRYRKKDKFKRYLGYKLIKG